MKLKPEWAKTFVPPARPLNGEIKIAIVGEQPGKSEIFHRPLPTPFVGPAGRELDKCLESAGIQRPALYLTNVIKDLDRPLASYIDLSKKVPVVSPRGQEYIGILKEELKECAPNVVVATGNIPLFALTDRKGITHWRGSILESTIVSGLKVIPTLHPATVIPPKCQYLNKHLIVLDLRRAKEESRTHSIQTKERHIILAPSFLESMNFLEQCITHGKEGGTVDFDIELYNEEVSCISFAIVPTEAISIPFIDSSGDYFDPYQEGQVWRKIALLLEDPSIRKRGQNLSFDSHFLLRRFGIRTHNIEDTMVAQKTLFPDYPMGLDFITTMYTDIPYYKAEGKKWFRVGGAYRTLWNYNAFDSIVCAEAGPKQVADLERQKNKDAYVRQCKIIEPLVYMQERGILVDVEGMKRKSSEYERTIERTTEEFRGIVGYEINPNSPKQLADYFYITKGIPPYRKRGGGVTTDDDALKRLIRKGIHEADLVRQIREATKAKSNYLNVDKVDSDNRIRCSYNPAGTRFSRISSSENIFGTGMNLQNWPHDLLNYLLFDPGYVGYTFDLSQAENRIVAYEGNIAPMIEAFESGKDVHCLTAALIFSKRPDEISNEPGSSPLGGGKYSERFWGKRSNHALNYDLGYKNFSLQVEVPEAQGKWIVDRYHLAYPGIRQSYHAGIKKQLLVNRTITNLMGRKTLFLGEWGDKLWKAAYSCIPQGTTGDKINEHGLIFIYYDQVNFPDVELLTQVHDSISFQIPLSVSWEDQVIVLGLIKDSLETPLSTSYGREFVIPAELKMGRNFNPDEGIKIETITAQALKEAYDLCHPKDGI